MRLGRAVRAPDRRQVCDGAAVAGVGLRLAWSPVCSREGEWEHKMARDVLEPIMRRFNHERAM